MPSSGVVTFSVTRDEIITLALQALGVMASSDTTSSGSFTGNSTMAAKYLNMLVKQWSGSLKTSGIQIWERKRAYLFLSNAASVYSLGPSGDHWVSGFTSTTLTAAAAASATALTVASITGISASDQLGIQLDSGALQWTTVSGGPSGSTVTAATGLTSGASSGNKVYAYTASTKQGRRPLSIESAVLRDSSGNDVTLIPYKTINEWMDIPTKTQSVDPAQYYYEPVLTNGNLYVDGYAADVTKQIYAIYASPVEDFTASGDVADLPQEWYRAIVFGLAMDLAFPTGRLDKVPALKIIRDEAFENATAFNPEVSVEYYQPNAPQ